MLFHYIEEKQINLYAENIRCLQIKKELVFKDRSKAMCVLSQFCSKAFATNSEDTVLKFKFNLCLKINRILDSICERY